MALGLLDFGLGSIGAFAIFGLGFRVEASGLLCHSSGCVIMIAITCVHRCCH